MLLQVIAKHDREVTADYLADMAYADMTCRETLRLAIVISQLPRRAQADIEVGGYTIPKASSAKTMGTISHQDAQMLVQTLVWPYCMLML